MITRVLLGPRLLEDVQAEASRAHAAKGARSVYFRRNAALRLPVVAEEVGEVARELNDGHSRGRTDLARLREELVQAAGTLLTWAQALDDGE